MTIQRGSDCGFVVKTAVSFSRCDAMKDKISEDICLVLVATFFKWSCKISLHLKPFCKKYHSTFVFSQD